MEGLFFSVLLLLVVFSIIFNKQDNCSMCSPIHSGLNRGADAFEPLRFFVYSHSTTKEKYQEEEEEESGKSANSKRNNFLLEITNVDI